MKKAYFYFGLCLILLVTSCSSKDGTKTKSEEMQLPIAKSKVAKSLPDPDPTDDIPAEDYLAASTSLVTAEMIKTVLQKEFKEDIEKGLMEEKDRKFVQFEYDLNRDGTNEILVGLVGPYFCGSGGCTQFLVDKEGNVITKFTVAGYPLLIDSNKSNGWNDLIIYSGGKNRVVKFDGKKYPSNPSVQAELEKDPGSRLPRALDFTHDKYPWFKF